MVGFYHKTTLLEYFLCEAGIDIESCYWHPPLRLLKREILQLASLTLYADKIMCEIETLEENQSISKKP